jgi:hypothetical protein
MTPDDRRRILRAELASFGVPADDITHRMLDRNDWRGEPDLDCMFAVDTILALRDQVAACRTIIESTDRENDRLRSAAVKTAAEIEEITRQIEILRDMLPEEVTDV